MQEKREIGQSAGDYLGLGVIVAIVSGVVYAAEPAVGGLVGAVAAALILIGIIAKGVEVGVGAADRNRAERDAATALETETD